MSAEAKRHDIVDYFDDKRISTGVILESDDKRLRLLNDRGQETKISPSRILIAIADPDFPATGSRDEQVSRIKSISTQREEAKTKVDLTELWEVLAQDANKVDIEDLADLVYGRSKDINSSASILRAISDDKVYFKIKPDHIEVNPPDRVKRTLAQREKEEEQRKFVAECADFIAKLKTDKETRASEAPEGLIPLLENAALFGKDWTMSKEVKKIFTMAGVTGELTPFRLLVKMGIWTEDENVRLRAENVPVDFEPYVEHEASSVANAGLISLKGERISEHTIAIDSVSTRDVDDALSLSSDGDGVTVEIHITNVAHFVDHDSTLDKHIRNRATSIYMPDKVIPMIPPSLSERAASLAVGEDRPAVTVAVSLDSEKNIKDFRIFLSVINLSERLSYEEADARVKIKDSLEAQLFEIALALRENRVASGALIFRNPELVVHVNDENEIEVTVRDKETPSQILVSEMMILANRLFAQFMHNNSLPGIYRSQPRPNEKIELGEAFDPVSSYRAKKAMARGDLGLDHAPHSTLGLDYYTTATSPLRRYPDLVVQRQLKSYLETNTPLLTRADIESILLEIAYPLERAGVLERERQRYFLLKYLTQKKGQEFAVVVLHKFPKFYLVQMEDFCVNAALPSTNGLSLKPYDRAITKINKINPREDKLSLSLVRLL